MGGGGGGGPRPCVTVRHNGPRTRCILSSTWSQTGHQWTRDARQWSRMGPKWLQDSRHRRLELVLGRTPRLVPKASEMAVEMCVAHGVYHPHLYVRGSSGKEGMPTYYPRVPAYVYHCTSALNSSPTMKMTSLSSLWRTKELMDWKRKCATYVSKYSPSPTYLSPSPTMDFAHLSIPHRPEHRTVMKGGG